ncbi:hypothetical protein AB1Y20_004992 [Prymnesium parvum]|uniref:Uncharacterized protein n=1 Tax=Prymnesium parvum TaxID=97485 RepID=A0AB34J4Y5_PRYPA
MARLCIGCTMNDADGHFSGAGGLCSICLARLGRLIDVDENVRALLRSSLLRMEVERRVLDEEMQGERRVWRQSGFLALSVREREFRARWPAIVAAIATAPTADDFGNLLHELFEGRLLHPDHAHAILYELERGHARPYDSGTLIAHEVACLASQHADAPGSGIWCYYTRCDDGIDAQSAMLRHIAANSTPLLVASDARQRRTRERVTRVERTIVLTRRWRLYSRVAGLFAAMYGRVALRPGNSAYMEASASYHLCANKKRRVHASSCSH